MRIPKWMVAHASAFRAGFIGFGVTAFAIFIDLI